MPSTCLVLAAGCRRFLNRLLGLPAARQNLLFAYFTAALGAEIRAAKAEGRYFVSICDLGGSHVSHAQPQVRLLHMFPAGALTRAECCSLQWRLCTSCARTG